MEGVFLRIHQNSVLSAYVPKKKLNNPMMVLYFSLVIIFHFHKASLTDKFQVETKGEYDFNDVKLKQINESLSVRTGISFDECAILCLGEQSFVCLSFTYSIGFRVCKWSSFNANIANLTDVFDASSGVNLFRSKFMISEINKTCSILNLGFIRGLARQLSQV